MILYSPQRRRIEVAKRRKGGVNKSQAIREILAQSPKSPVKEIVAQLGQRGIEVNPNLVYLIKSKRSQKAKRENRLRAVEANRMAGLANPVELILEVRKVAEKAGGMRHLKELVDMLAL
jgi:hypothetical protein